MEYTSHTISASTVLHIIYTIECCMRFEEIERSQYHLQARVSISGSHILRQFSFYYAFPCSFEWNRAGVVKEIMNNILRRSLHISGI